MTSIHYLREALKYIKAGESKKAISLLKRLLKIEPNNEEAWLLMAHLLENEDHIRKCYYQVLEINPENQRAREKLAALDAGEEEAKENASPFSTMTFTQEEIANRLALEEAVGSGEEEPLEEEPSGEKIESAPDDPLSSPEIESNIDADQEEEIPEWLSTQVDHPEVDDNKKKEKSDRNFYILVSALAFIVIMIFGFLIVDSLTQPAPAPVEMIGTTTPTTVEFHDDTLVSTNSPAEPASTSTQTLAPSHTQIASPTLEPIFTAEPTPAADQSPTPYPTVIYASIEEKWVRPVLAGDLAVGLCESIVEIASNPVSDEDILGALLSVGFSLGLMEGANAMVTEWMPPEEVAEVSKKLGFEITEFVGNAGSWMENATDLDTSAPVLEIGCEDIKAANQAALDQMESQGVSYNDVLAVIQTFMDNLDTGEPDTPVAGFNREKPFDRNEIVFAQEWEIEVLEYLRGSEAWALLDKPALYNDPPPQGWEYVMVSIRMKSLHAEGEEFIWVSGLDFNLTGSHNWLYDHISCAWGSGEVTANCMTVAPVLDFDVQALPDHDPSRFYINVQLPDPRLDGDLNPGEETSGWVAFMARQDETDLMLLFDDFSSFDDSPYIALEADASLTTSADISEIQLNEAGVSQDDPAELGEVVITDDWQIEIVDQVKGEAAWDFLHGYSPDEEAPSTGQEYIIFRISLMYLGKGSSQLSTWNFVIVDSEGNLIQNELYSDLVPEIDQELYAGGVHEGYLVVLAPAGEDDLVLMFEPWMGFSAAQTRYFMIE